MPYKSEKIKLPKEFDRRVKLTDTQRESIRSKYVTGLYSQRSLAKEYNVSRRTISFVCDPEKYEKSKQQCRERRKDGRYKQTKKEWAKTMRDHRRYKQQLYVEGKINLR